LVATKSQSDPYIDMMVWISICENRSRTTVAAARNRVSSKLTRIKFGTAAYKIFLGTTSDTAATQQL
jgi:hypothetical protein